MQLWISIMLLKLHDKIRILQITITVTTLTFLALCMKYLLTKDMNGVLGRDSALVRLDWAGDNLGISMDIFLVEFKHFAKSWYL